MLTQPRRRSAMDHSLSGRATQIITFAMPALVVMEHACSTSHVSALAVQLSKLVLPLLALVLVLAASMPKQPPSVHVSYTACTFGGYIVLTVLGLRSKWHDASLTIEERTIRISVYILLIMLQLWLAYAMWLSRTSFWPTLRLGAVIFFAARLIAVVALRAWASPATYPRDSWLKKVPSDQFDDSAPSSRLGYTRAQAAPTFPRAQPGRLGSLRWPEQLLAPGRPKVEDFSLATTRPGHLDFVSSCTCSLFGVLVFGCMTPTLRLWLSEALGLATIVLSLTEVTGLDLELVQKQFQTPTSSSHASSHAPLLASASNPPAQTARALPMDTEPHAVPTAPAAPASASGASSGLFAPMAAPSADAPPRLTSGAGPSGLPPPAGAMRAPASSSVSSGSSFDREPDPRPRNQAEADALAAKRQACADRQLARRRRHFFKRQWPVARLLWIGLKDPGSTCHVLRADVVRLIVGHLLDDPRPFTTLPPPPPQPASPPPPPAVLVTPLFCQPPNASRPTPTGPNAGAGGGGEGLTIVPPYDSETPKL